ncbi:HET-domain-containing protein, partial [Macroventuria anomochaeta]
SAKIDYAAITAWIRCCKTLHRSLCKQKNNMVRPWRLIDCNTSPPSLVLAPQSGPYLALSYTWGSKGYKYSTSSTDAVISCPPKTISDAITVTRELGYRFLWVDGYCIDQDGEEEKHTQIDIMDKIYGGAELTIVAAAGSDNDYGLPGVSTNRQADQLQESGPVVHLGDIQIVRIDGSPRKSIQSGTWATRAWTYQEAILSQRLLYFTDREIYFEC